MSPERGSKPGETAPVDIDNGTDSIKWVDNGMGSGRSPMGVTTNTESGGPHNIILACHTRSKWTNTVKLRENIFTRKTGFSDGEDCDMDSTFCLEKSLVNVTRPNGGDLFQPSLLISTIPSRCMSETANWNVDSETGSFVSMGSDAEISGLYNGSGDPLGAAPKCLELEETENLEASEMATSNSWTADRSPSFAWE